MTERRVGIYGWAEMGYAILDVEALVVPSVNGVPIPCDCGNHKFRKAGPDTLECVACGDLYEMPTETRC